MHGDANRPGNTKGTRRQGETKDRHTSTTNWHPPSLGAVPAQPSVGTRRLRKFASAAVVTIYWAQRQGIDLDSQSQ